MCQLLAFCRPITLCSFPCIQVEESTPVLVFFFMICICECLMQTLWWFYILGVVFTFTFENPVHSCFFVVSDFLKNFELLLFFSPALLTGTFLLPEPLGQLHLLCSFREWLSLSSGNFSLKWKMQLLISEWLLFVLGMWRRNNSLLFLPFLIKATVLFFF